MKRENKYFIHLCYNGNKFECETRYQVPRFEYVNCDYDFMFDCFDEIVTKDGQHHLFLDYGDCDDPIDVTYIVDLTRL